MDAVFCLLWWLCSTLRGVRVSSSSAVIPSLCLSMENPRFYPQLCLRFAFWFEILCLRLMQYCSWFCGVCNCIGEPIKAIRANQPAICRTARIILCMWCFWIGLVSWFFLRTCISVLIDACFRFRASVGAICLVSFACFRVWKHYVLCSQLMSAFV
jgi:hypothetical protein